MKKLIFLFSALIILFLPVLVFADTGDPPTNPITMEMFTSLTALAAGIVALTALLKNLFNSTGLVTDIISWSIGPLLGLVGWYFKLGLFEGLIWYMAILYGLLAAFYANKGWDLFSIIIGKKDANYKPLK
jgi:hypothetical protein